MNFKQGDIARYLKSPDPAIKGVVVFGTNEGMITDYVRQFAKTVCEDLNDAFQVVNFTMDQLEKDMGLFYGEYNARSLMGGRRVIIIRDVNNNLTAHLKTLFKDSTSDTLVIMSSSSLNTKSSLVSFAKESAECILIGCYDDRDKDLNIFAAEFLKSNGITIEPDAMQLLCSRLSSDRKASTGELDKLITYLDTRRHIRLEDVKTAISDTSDSSHEDLCYFTAGGNTLKALEAYTELLHQGEEIVSLTRSLSYHFLKILSCLSLMEKGQSADSSASSLRPPLMFYRKTDFVSQLRIWNKKAALDVLELLFKCERDCKTTNYPAEEILSYTLMQISGAAKKLSR